MTGTTSPRVIGYRCARKRINAMGKRSRKRNRAAAGGRPSRNARRRAVKDLARRLDDLLTRAEDSDAEPSAIAAEWLDLFGESEPPEMSAELLLHRLGRERAEAVADGVLELAPGALGPLLLRAELAGIAADDAKAVSLYEEALGLADQPVIRWCYALSLQGCGRLADAVEILENMLRADPGDEAAHDAYRDVLREINERFDELDEDAPCPCGSGAVYETCCFGREGAALDRFEDRGDFDDLREEVAVFLGQDEHRDLMAEASRAWLGLDEEEADHALEPISEDALEEDAQFFAEWALAAGLVPIDDEDPDAATSLLAAFAEDPQTSEASARRARDWDEHCHYGLWVVEDPIPQPPVRLREILTRRRVWVEMPASLLRDRARWEVLLGFVLPVDGIWRMGGSFIPLPPDVGDAVALTALEIVEGVALGIMQEKSERAPKKLLPDRLFDLPPSLRDMWSEPSPLPAFLITSIVKQAFPTLVREARELSSRPISLQNMDGEPLQMITARISLDDPARFMQLVSRHADFEVHDDEIVWHGRQLTTHEREQQIALLWEQGLDVPEADDPGRWVRAHLAWDDDVLTARVNSRERLALLLALLQREAGGASLKEEFKIDPSQDLPLPTSSAVPVRSISPLEDRAWRRGWVDESLPGLSGMTPREATRSKRGRILLESMLRRFEYEADRTVAEGGTPRDIASLRAELGLTEPWSYLESWEASL